MNCEPCHFVFLRCRWTHVQNTVLSYHPKYPCYILSLHSLPHWAHTSSPTSILAFSNRLPSAAAHGVLLQLLAVEDERRSDGR
jgi:hypothetical protein